METKVQVYTSSIRRCGLFPVYWKGIQLIVAAMPHIVSIDFQWSMKEHWPICTRNLLQFDWRLYASWQKCLNEHAPRQTLNGFRHLKSHTCKNEHTVHLIPLHAAETHVVQLNGDRHSFTIEFIFRTLHCVFAHVTCVRVCVSVSCTAASVLASTSFFDGRTIIHF